MNQLLGDNILAQVPIISIIRLIWEYPNSWNLYSGHLRNIDVHCKEINTDTWTKKLLDTKFP